MPDLVKRIGAMEKEFAFQEQHSFNVEARCSKLFGLWAGEKLGLEGSDVDTYAMTIVEANLTEPGFNDVLQAVQADFEKKGLDIPLPEMCEKLDQCLADAKRQLSDE